MKAPLDILLVDDFEADRQLISRLLGNMPFANNLQLAGDVAHALDLLEHQQFDCVLLDYHLPSGKGDEILEYIRYKNLPTAIVMLTSDIRDSVVDDCLLGGAQDFLNKSDLNIRTLSHAILFAIKRFDIEKDIRFSAMHDALTKLANRSLFEEHLEQACLRSQRSGKLIGLVMLDVDNFKHINDQYGHLVGDAALIKVAERLKNACRRNDTAARIGGDEFVLLLEGLGDLADARRIVESILTASKEPVDCGAPQALKIEHSVGIAVSEGDLDNPQQLLSQADEALYAAKAAGKGCFRVYQARKETRPQIAEPL